jgi:hypothetical protein
VKTLTLAKRFQKPDDERFDGISGSCGSSDESAVQEYYVEKPLDS